MTRWRRNPTGIAILDIFLLGAVIAVSQSCASDPNECPPHPMCPMTAAKARLTSGEVTLTMAGGEPETYRVGVECTVDYKTTVFFWEVQQEPPLPPMILCRSGDREISMDARLLRDPRRLVQDKTTYKPEWNDGKSMLEVEVKVAKCSSALPADTLVVDVTEARGQDLPTRPYVTSDYLRRIALHVETSHDDTSCGSVSIVADLTVEQAADDVVTTDVECGCL
ncbi:MAG TPA: hypothetical protein VK540_19505 [Polyangiaceae bacterium]|nr:hypothetical protein [Polyangiaceae bacterium]